MSWVGFELLHRSYNVGLSERRAQWFQRWTRETVESGCVHMSDFKEGLGRVMYVAGALEFERPFLSPLYRFLKLYPRNSVHHLPGYVVFVLRYLADQIQESRHYDCAAKLISSDIAPRVDAQASDGRTGVGGWCPVPDEAGKLDPSRSRWFSVEIDRLNFPWVFSRGDRSSRVIALESLAVLLALKAFYPPGDGEIRMKIRLQTTWTDNRGNGAALNKLMSTQCPINAVLMELAVRCKHAGVVPLVSWTPRLFNREADDLAIGRTEAFSSALEVKLQPDELQ